MSIFPSLSAKEISVALHPEGVDRNTKTQGCTINANWSPSTRRAWIEIRLLSARRGGSLVALHPEGVDRNHVYADLAQLVKVALHPEGVDRNPSLSL